MRRTKHNPLNLLIRRLVLLLLLALVVVLGRGAWGVYQKERDTRENRAEAETRLGELKEREAALHTDVASLRTDREREAVLRERYGLGREGEGVVIIVEQERDAAEGEEVSRWDRVRRSLWPF